MGANIQSQAEGGRTPDCSYEQCHERPGFFDVTDDAPEPYTTDAQYIIPFLCPEHGDVYEYVHDLVGVANPDNGKLVFEY